MNARDNKMAISRNHSNRRSSFASEEGTALKEVWQQSQSEHLEMRIDRLEEQMEAIKAEIEAQGEGHGGDTRKLRQDFTKSQREVENLKRQLKKSENDLLETRKQVQILQHKSQGDQKRIKELEEKEQKLLKQFHAMEEELNKKEATIRRMQKQMENMQKEILHSQKALKLAEKEFEKKLSSMESRFEERFEKLEGKKGGKQEEKDHDHAKGNCIDCTGDVNQDDVVMNNLNTPSTVRQSAAGLHLPPIAYTKMNFPPR